MSEQQFRDAIESMIGVNEMAWKIVNTLTIEVERLRQEVSKLRQLIHELKPGGN